MAEAPLSPKESNCSKCKRKLKHYIKADGFQGFPKNVTYCPVCSPKLGEAACASACQELQRTDRGHNKHQLPHKRFIEKFGKALQHVLPNAWLEKRRELQLQKQINDKIEKQLRMERHSQLSMRSILSRKYDNTLIDVLDSNRNEKLRMYEQSSYGAHYRVLVLGTDGSGKSTLIRQMSILYNNGFSKQEKKEMVVYITKSLKNAILDIIRAMSTLTPPVILEHLKNQERIEYLQKYVPTYNNDYPLEFYEHIEILWNDKGIQTTFQRRNEYSLVDNAKYFLDRVNIIKQTYYIPTDQDILHCYIPTCGNFKIRFHLNHSVMFDIFEIGPVRFMGTKWVHYFSDITTLTFVTACTSFGTSLYNDYSETQNWLQESVDKFKAIWNHSWFRNTSFIIFFNKQDLLREEIVTGTNKLKDQFPEFLSYQIPLDVKSQISKLPELTKAKYFIRDKFLNVCTDSTDRFRYCYPHFTCAVDTENIKQVFEECHKIIYFIYLSRTNLL